MPITAPEPAEEDSSTGPVVHVVAAALRRTDGCYLLTRRRPGTHLAGFWEFPGGKRESGESVPAALIREINEELGITPTTFSPLVQITHHYPPDKTILLDVWMVNSWSGEASPCEGQEMAWVAESDLNAWSLPLADQPVVQALRFSPLMMITPPTLTMGLDRFLVALDQALAKGVRMVLLRIFDYCGHAPELFFATCRERCQKVGARLICHSGLTLTAQPRADGVHLAEWLAQCQADGVPPAEWLAQCHADGVHLTASEMLRLDQRPVPQEMIFGVSCHTVADLRHAESIGADYAFLSPVNATGSHPGALPLGWSGFKALVAGLSQPASLLVYALGGLSDEDLAVSRQHGGHGIAGISLFLASPDALGDASEIGSNAFSRTVDAADTEAADTEAANTEAADTEAHGGRETAQNDGGGA